MTNMEKTALVTLATRLEDLASMENALFSADEGEDTAIKQAIKPYMSWFEIVAGSIKEIVEVSDSGKFEKRNSLEKIIYLNS